MRTDAWRGFPLFWAGRAASQFGDQFTVLALPWLLTGTTASPFAVGALQALILAPMLVFGLGIGAFADRRARRRTMVEADTLRLLLLLSFPFLAVASLHTTVAHVLAAAFLIGVGHAAFEAASQGFLVDLVERDRLVRANARIALTGSLAEVLGPAIAGVFITVLGARGAIGIDAVTFALSLCAVLGLRRVTERLAGEGQRVGSAIREGLRAVLGNRTFRSLLLLDAAANLGSGAAGGLIVLFLRQTLALEGWQAGILYAVNGVGGVAVSLAVPWLARRLGMSRTVVISIWVGALGFGVLAAATRGTWQIVAAAGVFLIGVGVVAGIIASATLRQILVPPELVGRATTTYRMAVHGAVAIGALGGGAVGEVVGVRAAMATGAAVGALAALAACFSPLARRGADPAEA